MGVEYQDDRFQMPPSSRRIWEELGFWKQPFIGGTLRCYPAGEPLDTRIHDLTYEFCATSAWFTVQGREFSCGGQVDYLRAPRASNGWLVFRPTYIDPSGEFRIFPHCGEPPTPEVADFWKQFGCRSVSDFLALLRK